MGYSGTGTEISSGSGTLVSTIVTAIGYRLEHGKTLSASTDPSTTEIIQWLNETALWITGLCAERNSDLGRTIGTITTVHPTITAATKANPCAVTVSSHGLMTSGTAEVLAYGVGGMTELNNHEFTATYSSANAVTLGIDSSSYTTYTSGGSITKRKFSDLASYIYAPAGDGWIVDDYSRNVLKLRPEMALGEFNPVDYGEPDAYYIDGSNNVCFFTYPDDAYTVKIPYYQIPTILTATTDTVPFMGLMNNVFIEACVIRAQNRDEYDLSYENKWQSFLLDRVVKVIEMRKGQKSAVTM